VAGSGPQWSFDAPVRLFEGKYSSGGETTTVRQYDVNPDGQRFLFMKDEVRDAPVNPSITVIQNWVEELKRLVPTR
jgi:hypothetical protein